MGHVKSFLFLIMVISALYLVQVFILLPPPTDRDLENQLWWRRKTYSTRRKIGLSSQNDTIDLRLSREELYKESLVEKTALRRQFLERALKEQEQMRLNPGKDTKYIVFNPLPSGFGNNLAVMAETLFIAFLTNRRFLLYRWKSFPVL